MAELADLTPVDLVEVDRDPAMEELPPCEADEPDDEPAEASPADGDEGVGA